MALCLLGMFTAIFGYIQQRLHEKAVREGKAVEEPEAPLIEEEECCGEHSTCEKDSLLAAVSKDWTAILCKQLRKSSPRMAFHRN